MRLRKALTALIFFMAITVAAGSILATTGYRVVDVQVEGHKRASESLILGVSSIARGEPLTPTIVAETIRRLYGLKIFSDVAIEAEEVTGGVKVHIVVTELPKLTSLRFTGNKKIKDKDFLAKLSLGVGGYVSPFLVHSRKTEIEEMYAEKGYFRALVEPELLYNADSTDAVLNYNINERSKVKVEKVVLSGNERVENGKVIGKMRNRKRGFLRSSDFAQDKYEEDHEKLISAFHDLGHIDAYLISDSMVIDTGRNRMTIFLEVYEGPRYYFGETEFGGNEELPTPAIERAMKFKTGDVFEESKFDKSMEEIYGAYYDIGHLHPHLMPERTTRADSIIDIHLDITEGLKSHVKFINIVGNTKTKEKIIRREISMLPGEVFNRAKLIRSVRDVMALNYFSNANPIPIDLPSGDVDLEFQIEEKQTGQVMAGVGYNGQDGMVGNVGMGIPNFRGNGQDVSFQVDFGSRRNSVSVSFTEPWMFGRPTLLGLSAYMTNRRWFSDYTEGRQGGSVRLGRRLRWPDNYFRLFASYRLERNRFFDFQDSYRNESSYKSSYYYDAQDGGTNADAYLGGKVYGPYPGSLYRFGEKWMTSSSVSFTVSRDSRNLPQFATSGSSISYTFENTGGPLGGHWNYQKHSISMAKFIPLIWNFTLAAKLEYGVVASTAGDDRILISDRYNPGGTAYDGIIRGYEDGSLTPDSMVNQSDTVYFYTDGARFVNVDPPDDTVFSSFRTRVRGKYMLVGNLELQLPIMAQQIYGLAFFDAGSSWLHRTDIKPVTGLYRSWGLGFRILIPGMGTLGFDFGYPLDDPPDGSGRAWKPHFQIGTTFR